jgi:phage/plasmid-like protein (TIGR03299 family)
MAAMIESMMFAGSVPWHGLGEKIDEAHLYSIADGMKTAGMDWQVGLKDLYTGDGEKVSHKACYRKTDDKVLGVVGPRWTPVQNVEMFEWFQPWLSEKTCMLHTAGSLCGGEKVWVLCQIVSDPLEIVKGDEVAKFILLANSHNGSMAVRAGFTGIRVVCCNTMAAAIRDAESKLIRLRHSSKVKENLENIREIMDLANQEFEATAEQYRHLAKSQVHQGDLRKYVKIVLGVENVADVDLPKKTVNIMEEIFKMVECGRGQDNPHIQGSYWQAYNGVNEYLNYNKGRNSSNRLDSLWFGQAAALNMKALEVAMTMAG